MTAAARPRDGRVRGDAWLVLPLFLALAAVLVPWQPEMPSALEESNWKLVLDHAFRHGWQFGVDVVFTFGPYGFLATRLFHPETYGWIVITWLLLAALVALGLGALLRGSPWPVKLSAGAAFVVAITFYHYPDVCFLALPLIFLFHALRPERNPWLSGALLVACGLGILVKFSFAPLAVGAVALVDARRVLVERRWLPVHALGLLGSATLLFALARQSPAHLADFASASLRLAAGYGQAMQLEGPVLHLVVFLAAGVLLIGAVAAALGSTRDARPVRPDAGADAVALLGLAMALFVAWKAGFVRQDAHEALAWALLVVAGVAGASRVGPRLGTARGGWAVAALLLLLLGLAAQLAGYVVPPARGPSHVKRRLLAAPAAALTGARGLLAGRRLDDLEAERQRAVQAIRRRTRLAPLEGSVDAYPWHQRDVLAHGLQLRSRPVFESFAAYDPALSERNRAFLRSERAPDHLLVSVESIDGRFPAADDGGSWIEMLSRYEALGFQRPFAVLRRRSEPREVGLGPAREVRASFGEPIALPRGGALLWAHLEIEPTPWGRIWGALFRMPVLRLELQEEDSPARHRLVPGAARGGFLVSPIVDDGRTLRALWLPPELRARVLQRRPAWFRVLGSPLAARLYRQPFLVRLSPLEIEPDVGAEP